MASVRFPSFVRTLQRQAVVVVVVLSSACSVSAQSVGSPTGREPRLIWTPERQAVWARMRADYEASPDSTDLAVTWFRLIKNNADCACNYGDTGLWATLMYQTTGDAQYVSLAWTQIQKWFFSRSGRSLGGNFAREYSAEMVLLYDWLSPGLTPTQRRTFIGKLNEMFNVVLTNASNPAMPVSPADSDQTVGTYFGLAFLYLATADHNAPAAEFFSRPFVGGLQAKARDRSTLRNAIRDYVAMAEGGEWIESSEYNLGTTRLLLLGAEGVRTATGKDYFAEVSRWARQAALRPIYMTTPDLRHSYQWGDEEHPGALQSRLFSWETTNAILAGAASSAAAYAQQFTIDLTTEYGAAGYQSAEPWARAFLLFNPYAPATSREALPLGWFASGQGLLTYRTGWTPDASMFGAHLLPQQSYVHHQVGYFGDFQLYRKRGWGISHPFSYNGPTVTSGEGVNAMLHGGFGMPQEYRGAIAAHHDPSGEYAFIAGTVGGQVVPQKYYNPPPTFLHEWSRSLLYVSSRDNSTDTIVVFDRSHAENPATLSNFDRYRTSFRNAITSGPTKQWIIHTPVEPSVAGDAIRWALPGDQQARVTPLLPRVREIRTVDEAEAWKDDPVPEDQRRWHVRVSPVTDRAWDTFLNVVQVYDTGAVLTSELVESVKKDVQGVILRRQGQPDVVALFNALPGPKLPGPSAPNTWDPSVQTTLGMVRMRLFGYTVTWKSNSTTSRVFLADLSPKKSWFASVDGQSPVPLTVTDSGLAVLTVNGVGTHTLTVY